MRPQTEIQSMINIIPTAEAVGSPMLWSDERIERETKRALFDEDGNQFTRSWDVHGLLRCLIYQMRAEYESEISSLRDRIAELNPQAPTTPAP